MHDLQIIRGKGTKANAGDEQRLARPTELFLKFSPTCILIGQLFNLFLMTSFH